MYPQPQAEQRSTRLSPQPTSPDSLSGVIVTTKEHLEGVARHLSAIIDRIEPSPEIAAGVDKMATGGILDTANSVRNMSCRIADLVNKLDNII